MERHQQMNGNEVLSLRRESVDELFAQHYEASLRVAFRILRSREDSEDAVQSAYYAAFLHLGGFRGESSFKTWITRIVVNCCLMQLRERRAKREVTIEGLHPAPRSCKATPEALCYLSEVEVAHAKAVARLPHGLQEVYVDRVISDNPSSTATQRLGLSEAALKSRLFRARKNVEHSFLRFIRRSVA